MKKLSQSGFREVDHTADQSLEVWSAAMDGLLSAAVAGMYSIMGIETQNEPIVTQQITVAAVDNESTLVNFLSELLFLLETKRVAFFPVEIRLGGGNLTANLSGKPISKQDKQIKAVTFHNLEVVTGPDGMETTLVFDV